MLFIFFLSSSLVSNISTITTILLENLAMFYMNSRLACILKKKKKKKLSKELLLITTSSIITSEYLVFIGRATKSYLREK